MKIYLKTRNRIENALYKRGINVALAQAEDTEYYRNYKQAIQNALFNQIKRVATKDKIEQLLLFTKAQNQPLETQIGAIAGSLAETIDLYSFIIWSANKGGQAALDKLEIDAVFGLKDPRVLSFFNTYTNLLITDVDEYTRKWIANKIQQGKDLGYNPKQIAELLVNDALGITKARAERIVLTELANAMMKIELEAARRYGIKEKIWRTSRDERVDPICVGLEGEKSDINDNFKGGYYAPPAHPLCRCYIEEVVPDGWEIPDIIWTGQ